MKRVIILLSVCAFLLGACGGGGGTKKEANGAMKTKLLTAASLPDGFKRTKAEETAPSKGSSSDTETCKELDEFDKKYSGERDAEADFERTNTTSASFLNESVKRFADSAKAKAAFSAFEAGIGKCKSFSTTDDNGLKTSGSFDKTDFASVGNDSYAALLTISQTAATGRSASLDGYFVTIRKDNHIFLIMSIGVGNKLTKEEVESVAKKAVANF